MPTCHPKMQSHSTRRHSSWSIAVSRSSVRRSLWLLILAAVTGVSFGKGGVVPGQMQIKGVLFPVYLDSDGQPVAICRAKHVFSDYQRRGFFRMGVLPLLVIDGFAIELRDASHLSPALTVVPTHVVFKDFVRQAIEARDFSLSSTSREPFLVQARLARLENSDLWRLQEGTVQRSNSAQLTFQRATLKISGPQAGQMTCETTSGVIHIRLLSEAQAVTVKPLPP